MSDINKITVFKDLGLIDYKECWDYQEELFNQILQSKVNKRNNADQVYETVPNYLLFCEHPHVYTLGKSGSDNNMLLNPSALKKIDATFYKINRGGDITYHGPEQIVAYPIIDLEHFGLDIKSYVFSLEEAVIITLKDYGISAERLSGATGVWIDTGNKLKVRKICAIGVKASRYVTMHGLAFNINTDLKYFSYINPCGFIDKAVTSLENEAGEKVDIFQVKEKLKMNLAKTIGLIFKK